MTRPFHKFWLLFACLLPLAGAAQYDLHFSQYNLVPTSINVAQTGKFFGSFRIGGIYRDQWATAFGRDRYKTPLFYLDAPVVRGLRKKDWIGVGMFLFSDQAGTANLRQGAVIGSAAYHLGFGKKNGTVLSLGIGYGSVARRIDLNSPDLKFSDEISMVGTQSPDRQAIQESHNYNDWNAGIHLRTALNQTMNLNLGVGLLHLNTPDYALHNQTSGDARDIPMHLNVHGTFDIQLNEKWGFAPSFLYQTVDPASEIVVQGLASYLWKPEKETKLNFGMGYRLGDAIMVLLGADIKDLRIGFAYDINTSGFSTATRSVGAFELGIGYIAKIYKKPVVKPAIMCPRF